MSAGSSIAVADGRRMLGTVLEERAGRHVARDAAGKRLGVFRTRVEAVAAIQAAAGARP